jgi:hypothetical protein
MPVLVLPTRKIVVRYVAEAENRGNRRVLDALVTVHAVHQFGQVVV